MMDELLNEADRIIQDEQFRIRMKEASILEWVTSYLIVGATFAGIALACLLLIAAIRWRRRPRPEKRG